MNLILIYNLFDGIELLEHNAKSLRDQVDFIVVHYQLKNWYGKKIDYDVVAELKRLNDLHIIDEFILFDKFQPVNDPFAAKNLEYFKRLSIKNWAKKRHFTHYLELDIDEFFTTDEFKKAKDNILKNNYITTSCKIYDYFFKPYYRKDCLNFKQIPFICSLFNNNEQSFKVDVDPTRVTAGMSDQHYSFEENELMMHHMETIRKDIMLKYESTSRGNLDRNRLNDLLSKIENSNPSQPIDLDGIMYPDKFSIIKTDNIFNLPDFTIS